MTSVHTRAPRGLEGLVVTDTEIGDVRGEAGYFHYRGHDATELARRHTFEEVWHLVVVGHLPGADELDAFRARVAAARRSLPAPLLEHLAATPPEVDRMAALRSAWSWAAGARNCRPWIDLDAEQRLDDAVTLAALGPVLVAATHGADVAQDLGERAGSTAAAYLQLLTGRVPPAEHVAALERYLALTVDHGLNASTFVARSVTSTGADLGSVLVAALGALSGPLHGGAPSRVLEMLDAVGDREGAAAWVDAALERGERIMGFGHRVYRTEDPRARLLREAARELGGARYELARHVEQVVQRRLDARHAERPLAVNVEYYAAVVLEAVGIPPGLFTPTFALSRAVGWTAHALEQMQANRIVRPDARYVGPVPVAPSEA